MFQQKKFGLPQSLIDTVAEATKKHTVPKTEREKYLAAMAHPKDKITHKDVLVGRGVLAKEETDGASKKKETEFHSKLDKLVHKTFGKSPEEKMTKEEVEQVDELLKSTLSSYASKAADDAKSKKDAATSLVQRYKGYSSKSLEKSDKADKRIEGVKKAVSRLAKEEVELDEKVKTTHENPLVTVHDKDGLHTHANLSVVNDIFNTKVKHTDVHKGPVTVTSGREDKNKLKIAISKHHDKSMKEEADLSEAPVDGVAAGSMEGDKHLCASKVMHKEWKEGTPLFSQHAEPTEDGSIDWYDVMFDHGIEKKVPTSELEILVSESHMTHKRKK